MRPPRRSQEASQQQWHQAPPRLPPCLGSGEPPSLRSPPVIIPQRLPVKLVPTWPACSPGPWVPGVGVGSSGGPLHRVRRVRGVRRVPSLDFTRIPAPTLSPQAGTPPSSARTSGVPLTLSSCEHRHPRVISGMLEPNQTLGCPVEERRFSPDERAESATWWLPLALQQPCRQSPGWEMGPCGGGRGQGPDCLPLSPTDLNLWHIPGKETSGQLSSQASYSSDTGCRQCQSTEDSPSLSPYNMRQSGIHAVRPTD